MSLYMKWAREYGSNKHELLMADTIYGFGLAF